MKQQLTLEHITSYLPYGLQVTVPKNYNFGGMKTDSKFLTLLCAKEDWFMISGFSAFHPMENFKPILRPMDLTKPIIVEGKEIVPIVELFKMVAFRNYDDYANNIFNQMHLGFEDNNWLRVKTGFPQDTQLLFTYTSGSFTFKRIEPRYEDVEVINQLKMFKWLYANFFDVDELIDAGLAIDVNTLETNPYNN